VALRLSDAALAAGPSADCLVSRAEALSMLGRIDEAEAVFVEAEQFAVDESALGMITSLRAMNLMHRGGRADEAARLLSTRSREVTDPRARAMIESMLMQGEGLQGDFRRALELGPVLSREVCTGDIAELKVLVSLVVARTVTGRLEGVEGEVARGVEIAQQLADEYPIEADQMLLNQLLFELTRPDVNHGLRLITERLSSSSGAGDGPWLYLAAWALSVAGDLDAACRAARTGLERLADVDPIGLRVLAAGAGAMAHAQSGDTDTAAEMIALVADDPRRDQPRSQMFLSRATTWLQARRGGTCSGAEHAARRGRFLDQAWHQTWGAWTAYDAVRLGHPELVVEDLERAASASGDGAVQLFARQARAYVDGDGATLADIANRFESVGARAHAAEAHAHASSAVSSPDVVARHRQRALVLASRCPGLASPVVEQIEAPLSAREYEIGGLAAAGRSSKEIADQLFVSPRTVDNHLGAAYSKLGLVGRAELAEWLTVTHSVVDDYSILV
jgi:DNA-binding CsgD family transcriptional regulator